VDRAVDYFRQICAGVQALHDRSIVHFDLKPANIYLKGELARVGDYGLSKLVSRTRRSLSFGRGTPYYMAPEMLKRRGDQRSDIYSLGVILFECLSADVPFRGDSEWEVLRKHESQEIHFPESVTEPYRAAIRKAMAKHPEDRFPSVKALRLAVTPARHGPAATATPPATVPAVGSSVSDPTADGAEPAEDLADLLLLGPFRLAFGVLRRIAGFAWDAVVAVAKVPVRLLEWGLHLVVFLVMVLIFFIVLHLIFKIPLIMVGIL
jgi:serine/threonine-protein kinase